ncbi:MAG: hypothetical protein CML29_10905 [Rhizobiales bacterium]|nr:hypothetical protein [Hyphomicrobiales bacterium]MBA70218.1 hypothetical protein [Hyphomicrobiales bacterium]|tara:strand:- start:208 stop:576 length:369 start_codon:yes stop_codon:yes gene_type:complete
MARLRHLVALIALAALVFASGPGAAMPAPLATATSLATMIDHGATAASPSDTDCVHCVKDDASSTDTKAHKGVCCDAHCASQATLDAPVFGIRMAPLPLTVAETPAFAGKAPPVHLPPPLAA